MACYDYVQMPPIDLLVAALRLQASVTDESCLLMETVCFR